MSKTRGSSGAYVPASSSNLFLDRKGNENEYDPVFLTKISDYYKKMGLIAEQKLPIDKDVYGGLEKAIESSSFHMFDNHDPDIRVDTLLGSHLQTDAAKELQRAVGRYFKKAKIPVRVVVASLDQDDVSPSLYQTNSKPNKFIISAEASLDDKGHGQLILYAAPAHDEFDPDNISSNLVSQDISTIIRHELVHDKQYTSLSKSKQISRNDAKSQYEKWGLIPDEGAPREQYLGSHIEIDAFGHEFAERLAQKLGIDKAQKIVSTADTAEMKALATDVGLGPNFQEYYLDAPNSKYTNKLHKKIRKYLKIFSQEGIYESNKMKKKLNYRDITRQFLQGQIQDESRLQESKNISEANEDGTVSADEDEQYADMMASVEIRIDELIEFIKQESSRIGGPFRGPGMRKRALALVIEKTTRTR